MRLLSQHPYRLLAVFLAVDALFMLLHYAHVRASLRYDWFAHPALRLDTDHGLAETFQYLKLGLIIGLLGLLFVKRHYSVAGAWAVVFMVILLDDALMLHERVGAALAGGLALPTVRGLGGNEVGELMLWTAAGMVLGTLLLVAYLRAHPVGRQLSSRLFVLLGALVFFGVVMDMLHVVVARKHLADTLLPHGEAIIAPALPIVAGLLQLSEASYPIAALSVATVLPALALSLARVAEALQGALQLDLLFTLLEDGGEMVVVSLTAAYCLMAVRRARLDPRLQQVGSGAARGDMCGA